MRNQTPEEYRALEAALDPLREIAREIGLEKPLADYTREEALTLIEGVVKAYETSLRKTSFSPFLTGKKPIYACYV